MGRILVFLAGAGFGAAAARWLIPNQSASRPGRAYGNGGKSRRQSVDAKETLAKTHTLLREIRSLVLHVDIPDDLLEGKLRAKIARQATHPELIRVQVSEGKVVLRGNATIKEAHDLVESISLIRGVKSVEDRFESSPEDIRADPAVSPEEQAEGVKSLPHFHLPPRPKPSGYPPAVAVLMGAGGLSMAAFGYRTRGATGAALVSAGAALFGAGAVGLWGGWTRGMTIFPHGASLQAVSQGIRGSRIKAAP